jgi:L-seryl-tRNA(Ser) seleniumtransferase
VDLVCFSGDKLLGGPQCGIIAGRRRLVHALKADPLMRALRCDKLVLTALQTVAEACLDLTGEAGGPDASARVLPLLPMLHLPAEALEARARAIAAALGDTGDARLTVVRTLSEVGGGTLPQSAIPSAGLEIQPGDGDAESLAQRLRRGRPAVIGYVTRKRLRLDLRAVFPDQDTVLAECLRQALTPQPATDAIHLKPRPETA